MKHLTIKDIANLAGVSTTAVSFVLNKRKGVSDETRERVKAIIESTNYNPSVSSRSLKLKKTFNVNVALRNTASPFSNLFYQDVTRGILGRSHAYNYNVVFSHFEDDLKSSPLFQSIVCKNTDGIIFMQDVEDSVIQEIDKYGIPCVFVDSHNFPSNVYAVRSDYQLSAYTGTKYLIEHGHKKIGFIGYGDIPSFFRASFNGYKAALSEGNLTCSPDWIQSEAFDEDSAKKCMDRILSAFELPTAVFCVSDLFAIGSMKSIKQHRLRIPEDISLFGLDDIALSTYVEPNLTTIHIDTEKMGAVAMDILYNLIEKRPCSSYTIQSDIIVERDSVKTII